MKFEPSIWILVYSSNPPFVCHFCKQPIATGEKCWQQFRGKRKVSHYYHLPCDDKRVEKEK